MTTKEGAIEVGSVEVTAALQTGRGSKQIGLSIVRIFQIVRHGFS